MIYCPLPKPAEFLAARKEGKKEIEKRKMCFLWGFLSFSPAPGPSQPSLDPWFFETLYKRGFVTFKTFFCTSVGNKDGKITMRESLNIHWTERVGMNSCPGIQLWFLCLPCEPQQKLTASPKSGWKKQKSWNFWS